MVTQSVEAGIKGAPHFFTGAPCKNGHVASRRTYNGTCVECARVHTRKAGRKRISPLAYAHRPCPMVCECCGQSPGKCALALDHNHDTGEFRGWLCSNCNLGLGRLGDNLPGVDRARAYLERADAESLLGDLL